MAKSRVRKALDPAVQEWLQGIAEEARRKVYGEAGCPEWGTKFTQIEDQGMSIGLELARLLMAQSAERQGTQMPAEALEVAGQVAQHTQARQRRLETEAGGITWSEPEAYLPKSRKAFFPSGPSIGSGSR